ncbi:MAG TPA: hypothetical protein VFC51_18680 [Chloroflexota bacterium]|nr:hypothetical protein [Chloroflexota bacterium]
MVSSVLHTTASDLAAKLAVFAREYADDPEYQELRKEFPLDWPM